MADYREGERPGGGGAAEPKQTGKLSHFLMGQFEGVHGRELKEMGVEGVTEG